MRALEQRAGQGTTPPLVSIVVRTIGGRDRQLRRALDSLAASTWHPLQVVVVYQGTAPETLHGLQVLVEGYSRLHGVVVQNPTNSDDRAANLNLGWHAARGRYLGFLDDDDVVAPDHAALLVYAMNQRGSAWAYGQCLLVHEDADSKPLRRSYPFFRRRFSYRELLIENFIPIHSFLLDRQRIASTFPDPPFHVPLLRSEDWDFLLRLAHAHEPAVVRQCICTYYAAVDGGNTNISVAYSPVVAAEDKSRAWAVARGLVMERMEKMLETDPERSRHMAAFDYQRTAGIAVRGVRRLQLSWSRLLYAAARYLQLHR